MDSKRKSLAKGRTERLKGERGRGGHSSNNQSRCIGKYFYCHAHRNIKFSFLQNMVSSTRKWEGNDNVSLLWLLSDIINAQSVNYCRLAVSDRSLLLY